jgi:hypothetical protein
LVWNYEVGFLEEVGWQILSVDELGDADGLLRFESEVFDLIRLNNDVFALAVLVAFNDVVVGHGLVAIDYVEVVYTLMCLAIDLVEGNFRGGAGGGEELNAECDEGNSELSGPVGPTRHLGLLGGTADHPPARLRRSMWLF